MLRIPSSQLLVGSGGASRVVVVTTTARLPLSSRLPLAAGRLRFLHTTTATASCHRILPRSSTTTPLSKHATIQQHLRLHAPPSSALLLTRALSSSDNNKKGSSSSTDSGDEETTSKEMVLTPGQKVVQASRWTMWGGVGLFALCCAYYIGVELFPTKMSPNRVFDRSFELVRNDPEVLRRYGDTVKGYGRDHGGHREGRRNFVEHTKYQNEEDGSQRTRVRYNLEGRFGMAFVFAEVSNQMPSGEFVYILVQDKSNGRVHTVVDNRAALTAQRLAAGSKEAQSAMSQLLSGSGGGKK